MSATRQRMLRGLGILAMLLWALAVGAGLERIWEYKSTPGAAGQGLPQWPGSGLISPSPGRNTLVMFVHPRCPCSRASLNELKKIMEHRQDRTAAWILFLRPAGVAQNWERTATWKVAQRIPGARVLTDVAGAEAARFGVSTSGHAVVYDAQGSLRFSGGITASRGHEGENLGLKRISTVLDGGTADRPDHPVYGCGFRDLDARQK